MHQFIVMHLFWPEHIYGGYCFVYIDLTAVEFPFKCLQTFCRATQIDTAPATSTEAVSQYNAK